MKPILILLTFFLFLACNQDSKTQKEIVKEDSSTTTPPPGPGNAKIDIETFGEIKIGQHFKETVKVLGQPNKKSAPIEWEADGLMHEDWTYSAKGLVLNMASETGKADSTRSIFSITAEPPCDYRTRANMGIGSSYDEVKNAYHRDIDTTNTDKNQITVGSVYGGIIFSFGANQKVSGVFLGAAAE